MRTAIYLRISSEDEDLRTGEKNESESISNQRSLLRDYVCSHADLSGSEILEFCDDGWSGTNFERPAVKELLEQVKRGQVNCIVVKDLSRFGRDYLTVGDYISRVFPFLGVRFISVNDGFDSSNPLDIDSLDTSFRTLIYDLYSRDLSRRVKSAKKARAERGAFLSPYAPYGYVKDPEDKNHLLVDAEAADVIRRIFQMAADGAKTWEIAAALNGEGVSSPKNYKVEAGCTRTPWRSIQEENFWTANLVAKFLRDERYIGKTVYGKRSRDIVGSTHTVKISRNDWVIVPDRHEAIVPEALFEKAQTCMREYREREVMTGGGNPLKRKVICGVCGHTMQRDSRKNGSYRCVMKRLNTGFDGQSFYEVEVRQDRYVQVIGLHFDAFAFGSLTRVEYVCRKGEQVAETVIGENTSGESDFVIAVAVGQIGDIDTGFNTITESGVLGRSCECESGHGEDREQNLFHSSFNVF